MTNYTQWKSLVDLHEYSAIPDSDVYLHDDWGDNKLQDREESGTTTHNGVEGVYRPEWVITDNTPDISDEIITVSPGDGIETGINLNFNETVVWEGSITSQSGLSAGGDVFSIGLFADANDSRAHYVDNGYLLWIDGGDIAVREVTGGSPTEILSTTLPTAPYDWSVERESNGGWTLFVDGTQQDTTTDTAHTTANITTIGSRTDGSATVSHTEYKVR